MSIDLANGLILLATGFIAGTVGIIVGSGGGFLFVPALLIFLRLPPPVAAGTGLLVVLVNSLSGISGLVRQKRIFYSLALRLAGGTIPGAFFGAWLAERGSSHLFYLFFAALLIAMGVFLLVKRIPPGQFEVAASAGAEPGSVSGREFIPSPPLYQLVLVGLVIGTGSSYFGIGGGWLLVPVLVYLFRVRPHIATATVIFSLFFTTAAGAAIYASRGNIEWMAALWGGAGIIVGAQVGVGLSSRISGERVIQLLALVLIGVVIKLLFT